MGKLRAIIVVCLLVFLLPAVITAIVLLLTEEHEFSPARMVEAPVLTEQGPRPAVLLLTEHVERQPIYYSIHNQGMPEWRTFRHLDLWAFSAEDFSPLWVQRLDSGKGGVLPRLLGIIGVEDGTIWVMGEQLHAVALADGQRIGGGADIALRNPLLSGKFPRQREFFTFGDGLVVTVADGTRWRIDPVSLKARSENVPGSNKLSHPLPRTNHTDNLKTRSWVHDGVWYGMAHGDEIPVFEASMRNTGIFQGEVKGQDFRQNRRTRLYSARVSTIERETTREVRRILNDFTPAPAGADYLQGGLLAMPGGRSDQRNVIGIANPYRLLVLHQDRLDAAARQTLTCVGLDGKQCWAAPLGLSSIRSLVMLPRGKPEHWGIILVGAIHATDTTGTGRGSDRDDQDVILRVAVYNGSVRHLNVAALDLRALSAALATREPAEEQRAQTERDGAK